jgi:hypothetical protein
MYAASGKVLAASARVEEALRQVVMDLLGTGRGWCLVAR